MHFASLKVTAALLATLATVAACSTSQAGHRQSGERAGREELVDALASAPDLHVLYMEDGASDATVTERPAAEVERIVKLGADAVPLLIEHLDDDRLTAATFDTSQGQGKPRLTGRATVGYVCLDILMSMTDSPDVFIGGEECCDDGLGANVRPGFYYRPGDASGPDAVRAKAEWRKAYREGKLKFRLPGASRSNRG